MMSTKERFVVAVKAGLFCISALVLTGNLYAADSVVPREWNVAPMRAGAYLEAFDAGSLPAWATAVGLNVVSNDFPAITGMPVRSNAWFDANVSVMQLETAGEVVTNTFLHDNDSAVSFASEPVYVDLRMKFDPLTDPPDTELLSNVKLALYVSSSSNLVVVHNGGVTTNTASTINAGIWYQVTVKLQNGKFDVLLNDQTVPAFSNLTLKVAGTANVLTSANFFGTGLIDELYVSHGDPTYVVTGPTNSIPGLPPDGANPPTDEEQTRINVWLQNYPAVTTLNLSQDELSQSYLMNELNILDSTNGVASTYSFGISGIEIISSLKVVVTIALNVNAINKDGTINGKIQLLGKADVNDATWTVLTGAITPTYGDFTNGEATYTFDLPGAYKFFKPEIVP